MWKDKTIHLFSLGFLGICPSGSGGLWFGNKPETEKDVRIFCSVSLLLLHSEVTLHLINQATQVTTGTAQQKLQYSRKGILSSVTAEPASQLEKLGSCAGYREEIHTKVTVTWGRGFYKGHKALVSNQVPSPGWKIWLLKFSVHLTWILRYQAERSAQYPWLRQPGSQSQGKVKRHHMADGRVACY